jgi:hypothetical protein
MKAEFVAMVTFRTAPALRSMLFLCAKQSLLCLAGLKEQEIRLKNNTTRLSPVPDQAFAILIEMNFGRLSYCWRQPRIAPGQIGGH